MSPQTLRGFGFDFDLLWLDSILMPVILSCNLVFCTLNIDYLGPVHLPFPMSSFSQPCCDSSVCAGPWTPGSLDPKTLPFFSLKTSLSEYGWLECSISWGSCRTVTLLLFLFIVHCRWSFVFGIQLAKSDFTPWGLSTIEMHRQPCWSLTLQIWTALPVSRRG